MAILALDRSFQSPQQMKGYYRYPGELRTHDQDPILRECACLIAPQHPLMKNLAPRVSPGGFAVLDPVIRQARGKMVHTPWGLGLVGDGAVSSTHSSLSGVAHNNAGLTLWGAVVSLVTWQSVNPVVFMRLRGTAISDEIYLACTQYVCQYSCKTNSVGPDVGGRTSPPYWAIQKSGRMVVVVGRTFATNSHQVDGVNLNELDEYQSNTDSTAITSPLDDTTTFTPSFGHTSGDIAAFLYGGVWNRALTDDETWRLLRRPMSLFRPV